MRQLKWWVIRVKTKLLTVFFALSLTGCSTISDWFADDEELQVRRLPDMLNEFEPKSEWGTTLGDGVDEYFSRLRPTVAYGKVFAASRDGIVAAFEPKTGKRLWQQDFSLDVSQSMIRTLLFVKNRGASARISGGLVAAYETIFFGTENGEVFALNQETGEVKWKSKVAGEVLAAPAIDAGIVVVNTSAGNLIGLDSDDGKQLWSNQSDVPPLSLRGVSAPNASNGGALVGTPGGKLQVSILESGLTAWEAPIASPTGATELERIVDVDSYPVIFGGTIYVISYNGTLAAVELRSGRVIWSREYGSYRNLTLAGNALFVVDTNSNLYAVDRRNGVELWSNTALRGRSLTEATPSGDYIVAGDKYGFLHWFEQDEGKLVARYSVGSDDEEDAIFSAPVADGDMIYVQTRDGELVAIGR